MLARRVFGPLGMRDKGFVVTGEKRHRCDALCGFDEGGRLTTLTDTSGGHALEQRPKDMTFESGGQGLQSTRDEFFSLALRYGLPCGCAY